MALRCAEPFPAHVTMDRYAVIGNPVAHSKSPQIHAAFARATGQAMSYERLPAPLGGFADTGPVSVTSASPETAKAAHSSRRCVLVNIGEAPAMGPP